jgi:VWFA-related protein
MGHRLSKKTAVQRSLLVRLILAKYAIVSMLFTLASAAQNPPALQQPTLRTQANAVLVPALVKDKRGAIVYGLSAADFIVEDDGVEQPVRMDDEPESSPLSLVVAIQLGRTAEAELPRIRTLGIMLDPILSSGRNRAAIVTFDGSVELVRNFTTNGALIAADLKQLRPGDDDAAILDAVGYSVALLKNEPSERRRILLLVSETRDHGSQVVKFEDTVHAITDSNTLVYTLAFSPTVSNILDTARGYKERRMPVKEVNPTSEEIQNGLVLPDGTPRGEIGLMPLVITAVEAMRQNVPKTVAALTGGEYELFTSHKGFESRMVEFANHLNNRYLLSFEPKDPHPGLHKIRVRLAQSRDVDILARERYWAEVPQNHH